MTGEKKKWSGGKIAIIVLAASLALCLPCIGILAAIAIPSFIRYVREAKTAEAEQNLQTLYEGATSYYEMERSPVDLFGPGGAGMQTHCTVDPAITPNQPAPERQQPGPLGPSFDALGFAAYDPLYYQYQIVGGPSRCGVGPNEALYTLRAVGDLDGDGATSTIELGVYSDANGAMYRDADFRSAERSE